MPTLLRLLLALLCMDTALSGAGGSSYKIETVAGSSFVGDGAPAVSAPLRDIQGLASDANGNLYLADAGDHRLRKVTPAGIITTVAGAGFPGYSGDHSASESASLNLPYGVAADSAGNIYIADLGNNCVRRVSTAGVIATIADHLLSPRNVAVDGKGNVYVSEFAGHRIRRINSDGTTTVVVGTGKAGAGGDGGSATLAQLNYPAGLTFDRAGNLYVADSGNHEVRKITTTGIITKILGTGAPGSGVPEQLDTPTGIAFDNGGNLLVADSGNQRIRKLTTAGLISSIAVSVRDVAVDVNGNVFAGGGSRAWKVLSSGVTVNIAGDGSYQFRGDGGLATQARLNAPYSVALDAQGVLWISDQGNTRIRQVSSSGTITTVAGPAGFGTPAGLSVESSGSVLVADSTGQSVRRLTGSALSLAAGNNAQGFSGDGLPATTSLLALPQGVVSGPGGIFFIADTGNHRIRRVNAAGILSTVAGNGVRGWNGDGAAGAVSLDTPSALALDAAGNLFFADTGNNRIRKLTPNGQVVTVAGAQTGTWALNAPRGVAVDKTGNIWIADTNNHRILVLGSDGSLSLAAGNGYPGFGGDGGTASGSQLNLPEGLFVDDASGSVYFADSGNQRIRRLTPPPAAITEAPTSSTLTVVNAASFQTGSIAPCSIASVFGADVGAAGAQILFDHQPVTVFTAQDGSLPNQANVRVPCGATTSTMVEVSLGGKSIAQATVPVAADAPGLFTLGSGTGQAVAVHLDGTLNSADHPAPGESVIVLYATGVGQGSPVTAMVGNKDATVLYGGDAPGFPGLSQINLQLPSGVTGKQPITVFSRSIASQAGVTLVIQ